MVWYRDEGSLAKGIVVRISEGLVLFFLSQGSKGRLAVGALETSRLDVGGVAGAEGCDGSAALGGATAGIDPGTAEGGAQAGSVGGIRGAGLNTLAFGEGLE